MMKEVAPAPTFSVPRVCEVAAAELPSRVNVPELVIGVALARRLLRLVAELSSTRLPGEEMVTDAVLRAEPEPAKINVPLGTCVVPE